MATGTVKWFNADKGFGFIPPHDAGKDLFVHHSAIHGSGLKPLAERAKASYDAEQGAKGPAAATSQPTKRMRGRKRGLPVAMTSRRRATGAGKHARRPARELTAASNLAKPASRAGAPPSSEAQHN